MHERIYKIRDWVKQHERHLSSLALLSGFIVDALTLKRVDTLYENLVLIGYFVLIACGIVLLNLIEARRVTGLWALRISPWLPLLIQFAFGGLFSGFTVFYFKSGSIVSSWPFLLILVSLLVGNEMLKRQYARLVFQITFFFVALFFFTIFFIPVLINHMGAWAFILSGIVALGLISTFVYFLSHLVEERIRQNRKFICMAVASAYLFINVLYFTNLIPPIPLSLKDSGVYHSITRTEEGYVVKEEVQSGWGRLQLFENIHIKEGDPLYVYSAVFAPNNIRIAVVHHWRYFDSTMGKWISVSKIPYTIVGGTDRGHRGYTMKSNLAVGEWTVNIETERGQIIGRVTFEVVHDTTVPDLIEKVL